MKIQELKLKQLTVLLELVWPMIWKNVKGFYQKS